MELAAILMKIIPECILSIEKLQDPREVWEKTKDTFYKNSESTIDAKFMRFQHIQMEQGDYMVWYQKNNESTVNEFNLIGRHYVDMKSTFRHGLRSKYGVTDKVIRSTRRKLRDVAEDLIVQEDKMDFDVVIQADVPSEHKLSNNICRKCG